MAHSASTNSLELSGDTKLFDRVARKWNVDYAFYQTEPGKYLLFFKSGQADAMTACFSEYSRKVLDKAKSRQPTIPEQMKQAEQQLAKEKPPKEHMLYGTAVDVTPYRKAVTQVGTAWGLPIPDTQRWLDLIRQEEIAVTQAAEPEKVNHVMEEKDLPINASGLQTLDNIWGLFETAVKLNSADGRREMYALARELSECQNLTDWIIKSQTENEGAQVSMACTQN